MAWIDHDQADGLLLLNADRFTAQDEKNLTAILATGRHTARQVAEALAPGGY
ncbi:hypothetical protein [Streptomyces sp. 2P-4]|uniref:hypothetical protein n=1 Tax=Streptomyces sp. 2P-4 TaxID=2931974 RepID=UPI002541B90E|nr:hypothetical protein [Streptomyces sp. 2P-4]